MESGGAVRQGRALMDISDIRFASSDGVHIAYQQYGEGPDVVLIPPIVSNIELGWEEETWRRLREHVGRHVRVTEFDKRGIGCSDPIDTLPTLEQRMADIVAVMDAEGLSRASIVGLSEGGLMAQLFAARHPGRVDRLVLLNSLSGPSSYEAQKAFREPGDPARKGAEVLADFVRIAETWGREPRVFAELAFPSQLGNQALMRWLGRFQRQTTSPAGFRRQFESLVPLDASAELAAIAAPTLVVHVKGDRVVPPSTGRWLAASIPGARYAEFPGADHYCWCMTNWRAITDCWLEFVTGTVPGTVLERRFATILFSDIVDSTGRCAGIGDDAWRTLLERHDVAARQNAERHGGRVVKSTGDGILATFGTPSAAVAFALALRREADADGLSIRAGIHAGEVEIRDDGDIVGLAVNLSARVTALAPAGGVWVSSTMRDLLLGSGRVLEARGEHVLKGIEGTWALYEVRD